MLTTLQGQPSIDRAHTTSCSGPDCTYPLTFTSLLWGAWRNIGMLTATLPSYVNDCEKLQGGPSAVHTWGWRQKWYYDRWANAISLEKGDLVLPKADAYRGKRKWRTSGQWEEELYEVEHPSCWRSLFISHKKPPDRMLMSPILKLNSPHHSCRGDLPLYGQAS